VPGDRRGPADDATAESATAAESTSGNSSLAPTRTGGRRRFTRCARASQGEAAGVVAGGRVVDVIDSSVVAEPLASSVSSLLSGQPASSTAAAGVIPARSVRSAARDRREGRDVKASWRGDVPGRRAGPR